MKQYDATSLPNPQIKHAKNVEFPLNDKDSYFGLKSCDKKKYLLPVCTYSRFFAIMFHYFENMRKYDALFGNQQIRV